MSVFAKSNCYQESPTNLHVFIFGGKYPIRYVKVNIPAKKARKQIIMGL
jgi:hypothetical protein